MSRTATTGGLIAVAALALTACSPVTTLEPYAASDGVRVVWSEDDTAIRGRTSCCWRPRPVARHAWWVA